MEGFAQDHSGFGGEKDQILFVQGRYEPRVWKWGTLTLVALFKNEVVSELREYILENNNNKMSYTSTDLLIRDPAFIVERTTIVFRDYTSGQYKRPKRECIRTYAQMDSLIKLYETSDKVKNLLALQHVDLLKKLCDYYTLTPAKSGVRGKSIKSDYVDALTRYVRIYSSLDI